MAAQNGKITAGSVSIYAKPDTGSSVVGQAKRGQILRMSDNVRNGFYTVIIPGKRAVGYVEASSITPFSAQSNSGGNEPRGKSRASRRNDDEDSGGSKSEPMYFSLHGQVHMVPPLETSASSSTTSSNILAPSFGGEFGKKLESGISFGLLASKYSFTQTDGAQFKGAGLVIALMVDKEFVRSGQLALGGGIGAGASIGTTAGAIVAGAARLSDSFMMLAFIGRLPVYFYVSPKFALGLELGYRYMTKAGVPLYSSTTIDVNFSSPYVGTQLRFEF